MEDTCLSPIFKTPQRMNQGFGKSSPLASYSESPIIMEVNSSDDEVRFCFILTNQV